MATATDDRGWLYLPKRIRDRFGDRYRIVALPNYVALFPVSDDPRATVEEELGPIVAGVDLDQIERTIEEKAAELVGDPNA